ncbi:MAG: hypothetical protein I3J02_10770 [Prevotella sp.]|nr:hypothetical protein [Prevotella sp.]
MKQYLIALALMLSLNATVAGAQPRHRHHPQTTQQVAAPAPSMTPVSGVPDSASKDSIVAYSDTTSKAIAGSEDTTYNSNDWEDDRGYSGDFHQFLRDVLGGSIGFGGLILALFIIFALLLCALAPFIVVIFLIRYFINRHNKRVSLAEKAMETGQPIPDEMMPATPNSPDYYWKKGIKNVAIGLGMLIMFSIWGADVLAGVGALVACWGVGQMVIAKTTK